MRKRRLRLTLVCLFLVVFASFFHVLPASSVRQAAAEALIGPKTCAPVSQPPQLRAGDQKPRPATSARAVALCLAERASCRLGALTAARLAPLCRAGQGRLSPGESSHPVHAPPTPLA